MNSNYTIEFTLLANEDLNYIFEYISQNLNAEQAAKEHMREFEAKIMGLKDMPGKGSLVQNETLSALGYRKIHVKNYVVVYSVDESNMIVTILRIFYEKSDYMGKLL